MRSIPVFRAGYRACSDLGRSDNAFGRPDLAGSSLLNPLSGAPDPWQPSTGPSAGPIGSDLAFRAGYRACSGLGRPDNAFCRPDLAGSSLLNPLSGAPDPWRPSTGPSAGPIGSAPAFRAGRENRRAAMAHGTSETLRGAEPGRPHAARGNEKKIPYRGLPTRDSPRPNPRQNSRSG